MFQLLVPLALGAHGLGHSVSLFVAAPRWFQAGWLLPGVGFLIGAALLWQHDSRWLPVTAVSAIVSLGLELAAPDLLKPGPYANAFAFNALMLVALVVPMTRDWLVRL